LPFLAGFGKRWGGPGSKALLTRTGVQVRLQLNNLATQCYTLPVAISKGRQAFSLFFALCDCSTIALCNFTRSDIIHFSKWPKVPPYFLPCPLSCCFKSSVTWILSIQPALALLVDVCIVSILSSIRRSHWTLSRTTVPSPTATFPRCVTFSTTWKIGNLPI
jgi:hypothetical protein